jgi:type I restriction enzyme S subunit
MSSGVFQKIVKDSMTGNAITRLTLTIIKGLRVAAPQVQEQQEIVKILSSIDDNIGFKKQRLESLVSTKKALMQDLLTGKVRVTAPESSTGH